MKHRPSRQYTCTELNGGTRPIRCRTFVSITLLAASLLAGAACNRGESAFGAGEPNKPLTGADVTATSESAGARSDAATTAGSPPASTSKYPGPPGYEKLAPAKFGKFAYARSLSPSRPQGSRYLEEVTISYNYADRRYEKFHYEYYIADVRLVIKKFASEAEARASVEKIGAAAVPADDYDKKVKLPRCDPNKETDYETPEVLVRRIPHKNGSEIFVLQSGKFWDYKCVVSSNETENIYWADGVYAFEVETPPLSNPALSYQDRIPGFGLAQDFFADYLPAIGQQ